LQVSAHSIWQTVLLTALGRDSWTVAEKSCKRYYRAAEESELPRVRSDLDGVIQRYRGRRRAFTKTLTGLQFLQRLSLSSRHGERVDGFDVDWGDLRTNAPRLPPSEQDDLELWLDDDRGRNAGSLWHGVDGTGPCHGELNGDGTGIALGLREAPLVEPVVTSARNDDPIPSLDELFAEDDEDDLGRGEDDSDSLAALAGDSDAEEQASVEDRDDGVQDS
jgi:hypothetical protein